MMPEIVSLITSEVRDMRVLLVALDRMMESDPAMYRRMEDAGIYEPDRLLSRLKVVLLI